jgi:hypothetical protein
MFKAIQKKKYFVRKFEKFGENFHEVAMRDNKIVYEK